MQKALQHFENRIGKFLFRQIVSNYWTKVKQYQVEVLPSFMQQTHTKDEKEEN